MACRDRSRDSCKSWEFIEIFVDGTILYSREDGLISEMHSSFNRESLNLMDNGEKKDCTHTEHQSCIF